MRWTLPIRSRILATAFIFRPQKTILVRTVADGGESFYIRGEHRATVPALREALLNGCARRF